MHIRKALRIKSRRNLNFAMHRSMLVVTPKHAWTNPGRLLDHLKPYRRHVMGNERDLVMGTESRRSLEPLANNNASQGDQETAFTASQHGMIGNSPSFITLLQQIAKISLTDASVLLEGETGVGKELAARAIHYCSARRSKPFIPLNCGAIPESLTESELFGRARGAFTDAKTIRAGVVAQAHGGTLFLDEIDSLSSKGQVALLRFMQDRRYRPVGHSTELTSDSRIVAATNQPLQDLVERRVFRSDLMYRLNIFHLQIPALRDRKTDIEILAQHFLKIYCEQYQLPLKSFHSDSWAWMKRYSWPGNVRELENVIHRNVLLCEGQDIELQECEAESPQVSCIDEGIEIPTFQDAKANAIAVFERTYLTRLIKESHGNVSEAARLACKERRSIGKLLKKHGIDKGINP